MPLKCPTILLLFLLFMASFNCLEAQTSNSQDTDYQILIQKAKGEIKLDGQLTESDWEAAEVADSFYRSRPDDDGFAATKTEVRLTYDERFLYIGAVCYDELPGKYVVQSLKRDYSFPITDAFAVFLDPFNNQTAGFSFSVSAVGAQREGLVQNAGQYGVTTSWHHKWFSKVTQQEGKWVAEMAIPFKTIRYEEDVTEWRINFARNDLKRIETSTWVPVPTQYNVASFAYGATLKWDEAPKKSGANIAFIPYISLGMNRDLQDATEENVQFDGPNVGFDAKIALSSALNLDLTVNPDFSQVEVDRQVTNLERFSIFFPEQRNFFLENSDLFSFGVSTIRPFFSRRIGLSGGSVIPILLGARLTGNLNENWRIGLMSVQTEGVRAGVQSQNFSVVSLQRKLLERSSVSGFLVNRQAFDKWQVDGDNYNRVGGLQFNYRSPNNKWSSLLFYHQSFTEKEGQTYSKNLLDKASAVFESRYDSRHIYVTNTLESIGEDYVADVGFVQELFHRNDETGVSEAVPYVATRNAVGYRFFPKQWPNIRFLAPELNTKIFFNNLNDSGFKLTDLWTQPRFSAFFKNNSIARIVNNNYRRDVFFPTNITGQMDSLLLPDTYHYSDLGFEYESAKRNTFYGTFRTYYGGFYSGKRLRLSADMTYRWQPYGNFSLVLAYNDVRFPEGFGDSKLLLLGPRLAFTFTKDIFFTTFFQYNTQSNNFNVNSRFQWRFAPMSDFFVVITDNLDTDNFEQKNWGIVMKLNYWLTL